MQCNGAGVIGNCSVALIESVFGFRAPEVCIPILWVVLDSGCKVGDRVVQRNRARLVHPADRLVAGAIRLYPNAVSVDALRYRDDIDTESVRSHQLGLS